MNQNQTHTDQKPETNLAEEWDDSFGHLFWEIPKPGTVAFCGAVAKTHWTGKRLGDPGAKIPCPICLSLYQEGLC